jgi:3-hydroxyisobutyrate dehydrogenase-like beta-hydroxyacid dehydrogenase
LSRVAFLGLGRMGQPMAGRVLGAGHHLAVWDGLQERCRPLAQAGARAADSPAAAVAGAELVISMVADPLALESAFFGPGGAAPALEPEPLVLEMSTVGPSAVADLRTGLGPAAQVVDAPVLGSLPEAEAGSLTIMVGASPANFERAAPVLASMGTPRLVGGPGSGAALKLAVNLSLLGVATSLGEAMALANSLGVERPVATDIISGSPWGALLRSRRGMIESGAFPPQLRMGLAVKDLRLIREAAEAAGVEVPVGRAALAWLESAQRRFGPDVDFAAVIAEIMRKS